MPHKFHLYLIFYRSDAGAPKWRTEVTKMTSSEAFVETLVAHDTKHIFGIVGSAFMDALDIFEPAGIRFVSVQHEQNAVNPQSYKDIVPYF